MGTFALLLIKDLRVEWNNRRRAQSLALFGAVLAVVIGASYRSNPDLHPALPTLIWVLTVFLQLLLTGQDPNRASLYILFLAMYAAILAVGTPAAYREFAERS